MRLNSCNFETFIQGKLWNKDQYCLVSMTVEPLRDLLRLLRFRQLKVLWSIGEGSPTAFDPEWPIARLACWQHMCIYLHINQHASYYYYHFTHRLKLFLTMQDCNIFADRKSEVSFKFQSINLIKLITGKYIRVAQSEFKWKIWNTSKRYIFIIYH